MRKYKHRAWNHICWSVESKTGINKMYLNGHKQGSFTINSPSVKDGTPGTDEVYDSAFIIGQDPDPPSPNGGYEKEQVFVGDITELNIWNKTLDETEILNMGLCKTFPKGNVVSWNLDNFLLNQVEKHEISSLEELCKERENIIVFPSKRSWPEAWTLCKAHGGIIFTPQNDEENKHLMNLLTPYESQCLDPVSGNLAWLGIRARNRVWYRMGKNNEIRVVNYTNWRSSQAPFFPNYDCGFIQTGGIWNSDSSLVNCNKDLRLCTACEISGHIFTVYLIFLLDSESLLFI